jgi:hypothetical protein
MWLIHRDMTITALFAIQFSLEFLFLILEATEKRRYLAAEDQGVYSPEETSSFLEQTSLCG